MGTCSNRNPLMPDTSSGSSVPHFAWFYPGTFFSTSKTSSNPFHGTQANLEPGIAIAPIRSIAPITEPTKNTASGSKPTKAKKQKGVSQVSSKTLKPKQTKKKLSTARKTKGQITPEAKRERKNLNIDVDKINFDFSGVPSPYCSCTGIARVCYKWGAGGWQSSCCTINVSEYPLPMSPSRPGARMAGRKMSNGAYVKLLLKLAAEGYDLSHPVDLKYHWARHGTNKFVTIK